MASSDLGGCEAGMTGSFLAWQAVDDKSGRGDDQAAKGDNRNNQPTDELVNPLFPFLPQLFGLGFEGCVKLLGLGIQLGIKALGLGGNLRVEALGLGFEGCVKLLGLGIQLGIKALGLGGNLRVEALGLGGNLRVEALGLGLQVFVKLLALSGNLLLRGGMQRFQADNIGFARQVRMLGRPRAFQGGDALRQLADLLAHPRLRELFQGFDALFQNGIVFRHVNSP